jgi:hypothetical protein
VSALLAGAPDREYALLELAPNWAALSEAQQRIAARLRLFVITRDPLDWIPNHGAWWATVYANGDVVDELAVYVLLPVVLRRMEVTGDAAGVLAPFAEAAVRAAADLESLVAAGAYPTMVAGGAAPRLLDRLDEAGVLGPPSVAPCSDRWEPMGLGAIQDLVQEAFGRSTSTAPRCPSRRSPRPIAPAPPVSVLASASRES